MHHNLWGVLQIACVQAVSRSAISCIKCILIGIQHVDLYERPMFSLVFSNCSAGASSTSRGPTRTLSSIGARWVVKSSYPVATTTFPIVPKNQWNQIPCWFAISACIKSPGFLNCWIAQEAQFQLPQNSPPPRLFHNHVESPIHIEMDQPRPTREYTLQRPNGFILPISGKYFFHIFQPPYKLLTLPSSSCCRRTLAHLASP